MKKKQYVVQKLRGMGCAFAPHVSCGSGSRLVSQFRGFFFDHGYPALRHADGVVFCIKLHYSVISESLFNGVCNDETN